MYERRENRDKRHRETASERIAGSKTTQPQQLIHQYKTDCNIFPSMFGKPVFVFGVGSGTEGHVCKSLGPGITWTLNQAKQSSLWRAVIKTGATCCSTALWINK
jgi:hypothetical protein